MLEQRVPVWLLIVVILACLARIFLLANEVDGDEFAKSGLGLATVGAIVAIWRCWTSALADVNHDQHEDHEH